MRLSGIHLVSSSGSENQSCRTSQVAAVKICLGEAAVVWGASKCLVTANRIIIEGPEIPKQISRHLRCTDLAVARPRICSAPDKGNKYAVTDLKTL